MTWRCILTVFSFTLSACALFEDRRGPATFAGAREQVYYATFDEVWKASNVVLQAYPLRISNMDQGILETDSIRGNQVWSPPYKPEGTGAGESYRIQLRVAKGNISNRSAIKVSILKDTQVQVDFFSDPKSKPSDGFEERVLLYRIGREIQIDHALVKAQKRANQSAQSKHLK